MSQHSFEVENGTGAAVRYDMNLAFKSLASMSNGPISALSATYPDQLVSDTTSGYIMKRRHDNTDWDYIMPIDQRLLVSQTISANYTLTYSPEVTIYVNGAIYQFVAHATCGDNPSFSVNSLPPKQIKRFTVDGTLVNAQYNCIVSPQIVRLQYSWNWDCFIILNPATQILPSDVIAQIVTTQDNNWYASNSPIPFDNTVPQSWEGSQFLSIGITPKDAGHWLRIEANLETYSTTLGTPIIAALFRFNDYGSDAIAATYCRSYSYLGINTTPSLRFDYWMQAGTTNSISFSIRAGLGGSGTLHVNAIDTGHLFGWRLYSSITVTEIARLG